MKQMIKAFAALLFLCITVPSAMAGNYYVAADLGQTTAGNACDTTGMAPGITVNGCQDTASMFKIAAGYQVDRRWATEFSYDSYGGASLGYTSLAPSTSVYYPLGNWRLTGLQIAEIASFPVGNDFSLFGKLGLAWTRLRLSRLAIPPDARLNPAYGFGAQYDISPSVAARAQYENLGDVGGAIISVMSVGLAYKF